jgi:hypothetical protein
MHEYQQAGFGTPVRPPSQPLNTTTDDSGIKSIDEQVGNGISHEARALADANDSKRVATPTELEAKKDDEGEAAARPSESSYQFNGENRAGRRALASRDTSKTPSAGTGKTLYTIDFVFLMASIVKLYLYDA